ncbi:N-acetylmuramoyl-L-alanine amidase [Nitratireductor sp. B36]|uniref:N-acetylmuramoyl-L-alanine amidase n=1 Tax=Nitratireductor sp. B36 TaxID=2762059 RepID=UPI001E5DAA7A|nr:N-acetylmuramoyl-L-alanine amidase [Nitratireductor sp. B36]MCC5780559.1 N-acetylmuramoyl-L-alanine amidase [Nitratireductor sp. B36]
MIRYKDRKSTKLIILHDSHTLPEVCNIEDVPRWAVLAHKQGLKMGLLSIGYHYIIERDGTEVECRPVDQIGSHTPGLNLESVSICLVGGREEIGGIGVDNFTRDQRIKALGRCHQLLQKYPGAKVVGHSEVQRYRRRDTPPCPPIDMDLFREDLKLYAQGIVL